VNKVSSTQAALEFSGHQYIRQIVTLSLLSGRQVIIKDIRSGSTNPGLTSYEMNLLELVEKITNGTQITINKTGTRLILHPGIIDSNEGLLVEHQCDLTRNISYYLEVVCPVAVFGKSELNMLLSGNTDDFVDQSVDSFSRAFTYLME
jgi:RNA 3'-terminal phosphate cyclase-like protein